MLIIFFFFFSSRRRHTSSLRDWSSDVCSSDLAGREPGCAGGPFGATGRAAGDQLQVRQDLATRGSCWTPRPRPPTRPGSVSSRRSWTRRTASTTRSVPPAHAKRWTSWWANSHARSGWEAGIAGQRPTPSAPGSTRPGRSEQRWPTPPEPTPPLGSTSPPQSERAATAPTPQIPAPRSTGSSDAPGPSASRLNNGAVALNASLTGERPRREGGVAQAADMLIRISAERTQPVAGSAATKGSDPRHFDGRLDLLRVISELVAAGGGDVAAT